MYNFETIEDNCILIDNCVSRKLLLNKKVLILGGNSFLASNLQYYFYYLNKNFNAKILVTTCSLNKPKLILKRILNKDKLFKFKKLNLLNFNKQRYLKKKYDFIFYLATYGQPQLWLKDELNTIKLNSVSLKYFLDKATNDNSKIMYFSSGDVYGENKKLLNEDSKAIVNLNDERLTYASSKRIGEAFCRIYKKKYKTKVFIVRPGHTYGPGMLRTDKRVLVELIMKGLNSDVKLLDNGKAKKTFGYIADVTAMFINIITRGKRLTYNTTGRSHVSISLLAKTIANFLNKKVIYGKSNSRHVGTGQDKINIISKNYHSDFKKHTYIKLKEGIKRTILWFLG